MENLNTNQNNRYTRNIILLVIIYFLMGLVKGIEGDGLMSYIHLTMPTLSKGIGIYSGLSLFVAFFAVLLVGSVGFKKMLILIYTLFTISMVWLMFTTDQNLARILLIFIELGKVGAEAIITLALMAYTEKGNRIKIFSYAIFFNVLGEAISSFFDGKIVVYKFKSLLGVSYDKANALTKHAKHFKGNVLLDYLHSYKTIIWIGAIIAVVIIVLVILGKETKDDYKNRRGEELLNLKDNIDLSVLKNKYIIGWIIFSILFNLESSIVTPHLPIYFNSILHISRGVTSTILALKSLGMMVFILMAPYIIRKMGKIASLSMFLFMTVPLLILMGIGNIFGAYVVIAMSIFAFCKWGCTHATHPVTETLPLSLVSKGARPIFLAVLSLINAIISIVAGYFAKIYLYDSVNGYHVAFFVVALAYFIAACIALGLYYKKFNRA
ncbi:MAG: MFS transporter [Sarcina sp.]